MKPLLADPVRCGHCGCEIEFRRGQTYVEMHHFNSSVYLDVEVRALGDGDFDAGLARIAQEEQRPERHHVMFRSFNDELEPLRPFARLEYDAKKAMG